MTTYEIRPARPADSEAIESVRVATWKTAYRGVIPDDELDAMSVEPGVVGGRASMLADGRVSGLVAVHSDEVHGFCLYGQARDTGHSGMEVYAIYVLPSEFSTGMGRALMDDTLERLDGQEVGLWVLAKNPRARRFYERCGFTPTGLTKSYSEPPVEEVHYRLSTST